MSEINFFTEDVSFTFPFEEKARLWLKDMSRQENKTIEVINYIFCSDAYLHSINLQYLNHNDYTDIITFPYRQDEIIEADIFISLDRVKENAEKYDQSFMDELIRVMAHGILHLCGYNDKTETETRIIREMEEKALRNWKDLELP